MPPRPSWFKSREGPGHIIRGGEQLGFVWALASPRSPQKGRHLTDSWTPEALPPGAVGSPNPITPSPSPATARNAGAPKRVGPIFIDSGAPVPGLGVCAGGDQPGDLVEIRRTDLALQPQADTIRSVPVLAGVPRRKRPL